jgi:RNA polymerase sigma factor (sigma-70 family)
MGNNIIAYDRLSDLEIVQHILEGDPQAVAFLLIQKCGSRLKYLCSVRFQFLGIEFDELVSETYELLSRNDWKALCDFHGENSQGVSCKIENYISVIVSRYLTKKKTGPLTENSPESPLVDMENYAADTDDIDQVQLSREVMDAVMALTNPRERQVLILYKLGGYGVDEVSRLLAISPSNVYTLCSRAIAHLKSILEERGIYG